MLSKIVDKLVSEPLGRLVNLVRCFNLVPSYSNVLNYHEDNSYLSDQPLSNQKSVRLGQLQQLDYGGRCERMFVFPQTEADDDDDE